MDIIKEIAEFIGIDPAALQGIGGTSIVGIISLYLRGWYLSKKTDDKQVTFEQKLVEMTADSVEESRKLRTTFDDTAQAMRSVSDVLTELVIAAKELKTDVPLKITEHEAAIVKMFVDKADEMHSVTQRRDEEHSADRAVRDNNHTEIMDILKTHQQSITTIQNELTNVTDITTLRGELHRIGTVIEDMIQQVQQMVKKEEIQNGG
jgi:oligoendopeptidase F